MDAVKLSVLQKEAVSPSLGFCTVTDTGPVQVLYRDDGDGRRVFESVAQVGCGGRRTPRHSPGAVRCLYGRR